MRARIKRGAIWTNAYSAEDLGAFLQEVRKKRGITQKEMAEMLGYSTVTLSALETGKNVSYHKIEKYLQLLGMRLVVVPKTAAVEVRE